MVEVILKYKYYSHPALHTIGSSEWFYNMDMEDVRANVLHVKVSLRAAGVKWIMGSLRMTEPHMDENLIERRPYYDYNLGRTWDVNEAYIIDEPAARLERHLDRLCSRLAEIKLVDRVTANHGITRRWPTITPNLMESSWDLSPANKTSWLNVLTSLS